MSDHQVVPVDAEVFELMDREDEEQVLAELQGRVSEAYVYAPKRKDGTPMKNDRGEPVTGLSYAGTNWACREYAKHGEAIRIVSKPEIQLDPTNPEYVIISVVVQRFSINIETGREVALDSAIGVKRQWTKQEKNVWRDGQVVGKESSPDPFFIEKACSKAMRNGKQALLPTDFVKRMIVMALESKGPRPPAIARRPAGDQKAPLPQRPAPEAAKAAPQPAAPPAAPAAPQGAAKAAGAPMGPQGPVVPRGDTTAPQPPPAKPHGAPADQGALRQRFWAVLKQATGAKDEAAARAALKGLVGKEKVSDLQVDVIQRLGPILRDVAQGVARLGRQPNGAPCVVNQVDGSVLWPVGASEAVVAAPKGPEAVPTSAPEPDGAEEAPMF